MKRHSYIIAVLLLLAGTAASAAQKDTLKVLAIGNSFSQDAVEQNLHEIAKEDGQEMIIGNMYIGGCTLQRHYDNYLAYQHDYDYRKVGTDGVRRVYGKYELHDALKDEKWDVVTLQQASGFSGEWMSYEPYLTELIHYVHQLAPQAQVRWHQTWAYATGAVHSDFPRYDCDQVKMYEAIVYCSSRVDSEYGLKVIPSGTAVQNLRNTVDRDNVTRDGFHLNHTIGRYMAALTWYEALTGRSVLGISYHPEGLTADRADLARRCAHAAVLKPFGITQVGPRKVATNMDEAAVAPYVLPDALTSASGKKIRNAKQWNEVRRTELLDLFEKEMYGTAPGSPDCLFFQQVGEDQPALGGKAIRRYVRICYTPKRDRYLNLVMYLPAGVENAPVFLGANFNGNHTTVDDPDMPLVDRGQYGRYAIHTICPRAQDKGQWEVEQMLARGYGFATFCAHDADPDFEDSRVNGVQANFDRSYTWCTIAEWAWGLSRAMDYLQTAPGVDASRVAVVGFSRMGKAALWAGAKDQRFAMVVSLQSGAGGAALARHTVGESLAAMNAAFPHWYTDGYKAYNNRENELPFDQHELLALVAPRPLYVASASKAVWINPTGEQKAADEVRKIYRQLWGSKAVAKVGSHVSDSKHVIVPEDWTAILDFADKNL